ncbi:hypothetical protein SHO565_52250 [Streptomyces sp. HO565]
MSSAGWTSAGSDTTPPPSLRAGKKAFGKRAPSTEPPLRELFAKQQAEHERPCKAAPCAQPRHRPADERFTPS